MSSDDVRALTAEAAAIIAAAAAARDDGANHGDPPPQAVQPGMVRRPKRTRHQSQQLPHGQLPTLPTAVPQMPLQVMPSSAVHQATAAASAAAASARSQAQARRRAANGTSNTPAATAAATAAAASSSSSSSTAAAAAAAPARRGKARGKKRKAPAIDYNPYGYDPSLPTLRGDPRLNPGRGLGTNWHPSQPVRNEWADWGETEHPMFDISTKEFVPTKTAKGAIVFPDAAALQRVLEMSALIGARASMQAAGLSDAPMSTRTVAANAAAAAAVSAMTPYLMAAGKGMSLPEGTQLVPKGTAVPTALHAGDNGNGGGAAASGGAAAAAGGQRSAADTNGAHQSAESKRKARLERNRVAAREARRRQKHRVDNLTAAVETLGRTRETLAAHRWEMPADVSLQILATSRTPRGEHPTRLREALGEHVAPYSEDTDNYADLIVAISRVRSGMHMSHQERLQRLRQSMAELRHLACAVQCQILSDLFLTWGAENACVKKASQPGSGSFTIEDTSNSCCNDDTPASATTTTAATTASATATTTATTASASSSSSSTASSAATGSASASTADKSKRPLVEVVAAGAAGGSPQLQSCCPSGYASYKAQKQALLEDIQAAVTVECGNPQRAMLLQRKKRVAENLKLMGQLNRKIMLLSTALERLSLATSRIGSVFDSVLTEAQKIKLVTFLARHQHTIDSGFEEQQRRRPRIPSVDDEGAATLPMPAEEPPRAVAVKTEPMTDRDISISSPRALDAATLAAKAVAAAVLSYPRAGSSSSGGGAAGGAAGGGWGGRR